MVQFLRGLAKIVILAASLQQLITQWETLLSLQVTVLGTWLHVLCYIDVYKRQHVLPAAADGQRGAGIGGGDAALHRGGIQHDVIAVVVPQDAQRGVAVIGQRNGPPLGKPCLLYTSDVYKRQGQVISRPESTWKCRCCTVWPACSPQLVTTR